MTPAAFVRGCAWHLGLIVAVLLGVAFYLGYAVAQAEQPDCPTEDSCTIDYDGDGWVIEEVTP